MIDNEWLKNKKIYISENILIKTIHLCASFHFWNETSFALDLSKIVGINTSTIEKEDSTRERNRKLLVVSCAYFILFFFLYFICIYIVHVDCLLAKHYTEILIWREIFLLCFLRLLKIRKECKRNIKRNGEIRLLLEP